MAQLENIEAIERRLWKAADDLRTNSGLASNEYFLPVMGLVFLRHAYSRFLTAQSEAEQTLPKRGGKTRELTKADFAMRGAIFLQPKAQFDYLVELSDDQDRAKAIVDAMKSIEKDYQGLQGVLPQNEYQKLGNDVLGRLLRTLNPEELKRASGDIFGRIYEYFLTRFAGAKAHDAGEFFTPVSLVSTIAGVIEPQNGAVLDPACGSGGMFVQSAKTLKKQGHNPTERLTFYGLESNDTTVRLGKMNLAVHGLEGDIQQANTYYEDPHKLLGKADFVMANPPFNADEIDAEKVEHDPRLPFGLPGIKKDGKVTNGNYVWISYFHSYLNQKGRAGFVMSSQASSASHGEAKVRQQLVETGDIEVMIAIGTNFFYTRPLPCELWFFNRNKPKELRDKVLMIDARKIFRQVSRTVRDFSPEQQQSLLAIVWLYRGEVDRFTELIGSHCYRCLEAATDCVSQQLSEDSVNEAPPVAFAEMLSTLVCAMSEFVFLSPDNASLKRCIDDLEAETNSLLQSLSKFGDQITQARDIETDDLGPVPFVQCFTGLADASYALVKQVEELQQQAKNIAVDCMAVCGNKPTDKDIRKVRTAINSTSKACSKASQTAIAQLNQVAYFYREAMWLAERFPEAELRDVEGLVKVVDHSEIAKNDWSLAPGRYVGFVPDEDSDDLNFAETMKDIHSELATLNVEATALSETIQTNFEELGVK